MLHHAPYKCNNRGVSVLSEYMYPQDRPQFAVAMINAITHNLCGALHLARNWVCNVQHMIIACHAKWENPHHGCGRKMKASVSVHKMRTTVSHTTFNPLTQLCMFCASEFEVKLYSFFTFHFLSLWCKAVSTATSGDCESRSNRNTWQRCIRFNKFCEYPLGRAFDPMGP